MARHLLELRREYPDHLAWYDTDQIVDELIVSSTPCGCGIEDFRLSPSGNWIITARWSGNGQWGYDLIRSHPLERCGGIRERNGYILDVPQFAADESYVLGGFGEKWLGARDIGPIENNGVKLILPGNIPFECPGPLSEIIQLPVPHPHGGILL